MPSTIHIHPRYEQRAPAPGEPRREQNHRYVHLDWDLPLSETALICLDIWNYDLREDMREIDDRITRERIVPVVAAARQHGLQIIHAPAPQVAQKSPNWVKLIPESEKPQEAWPNSPDWPPREFRHKSGQYEKYARPEPWCRAQDIEESRQLDFHDLVRPEGDEAVILTGEELHRLCHQRGILHLIYVGFHVPGCVTLRNYGLPQMDAYGYHCILVRDCTNGMESHTTFKDQGCMRGAIAFLEQIRMYTLESPELISALEAGSV